MQQNDNPLGDIDPMAWLESLAARQGASEGFLTDHNIDVPEVDPNSVVIDEPGYVPYDITEGRGKKQQEAEAAPPPPAEAPAMPEQPYEQAAPPAPAYDNSAYDPAAYAGQGYDQQGYDPNAYTGYEQQGYDPNAYTGYEQQQGYEQQAYDPNAYAEQPPAYPPAEAPAPAAMDMSGGIPEGVDPMAWLEALAARQGASEGFTTEYSGIDVPEIDPNSVVIDEPGYVPYDITEGRGKKQQEAEAAPPPPAEAPPAPAEASLPPALEGISPNIDPGTYHEPGEETSAFLSSLTDESAGAAEAAGTLDWLDMLSQQAGAEADNLLGTAADEPAEQEAIPPTHTDDELIATIAGLSDEQIAQMQVRGELSPEQEAAWLMRQAKRAAEDYMQAQEEIIDYEDLPPAQATEVPEWLQHVTIREDDDAVLPELGLTGEDEVVFTEDSAMPELENAPEWLQAAAPPNPFDFQEEGESLDLPDFTLESAEPVAPFEAGTFEAQGELPDFLDLDTYDPSADDWAQALDEEFEREQAGLVDEEPSWFTEAMEQIASDEDDFIADLADVLPEAQEDPFDSESTVAAPTEGDLSSWLSAEDTGAGISLDMSDDDLPDWLRPVAEAGPAVDDAADIGAWLRQEQVATQESDPIEMPAAPASAARQPSATGAALPDAGEESLMMAETGEMPVWAQSTMSSRPAAPAAAAPARPAFQPTPPRPAPARTAPPPRQRSTVAEGQPVPPSQAPAPIPAGYEQFRAQLEENPGAHDARLGLARAMAQSGNLGESLQQYETLVDHSASLEDVTNDLLGLVTHNPAHPVARRVLGDAYMRMGYLQEALDAYRGALESL